MRDQHREPGQEAAAVARLLPEASDRDLPAGRRHVLREHLMSEIRMTSPAAGAGGSPAGPPAPRQPGRRRHVVVIAAAASTAGALAAGITLSLHPAAAPRVGGESPVPAGMTAPQLLARIATAAARQPVPAVRDDQFVYIESQVAFTNTIVRPGPGGRPVVRSRLEKLHGRQIWYSVANLCRPGLLREHGASTPLTETAGCPDRGSLNDPTYRFLQSLPTDPRALLRLIYRQEKGHGTSPDQEAFTTIGDLLRESIAPPGVTAALYRAAALIPGVTVVRHARDAIGRPGVAVAFDDAGLRSEWIFNTSTWRFIGERDIVLRSGATGGVSAILARGFVDHAGQLPGR